MSKGHIDYFITHFTIRTSRALHTALVAYLQASRTHALMHSCTHKGLYTHACMHTYIDIYLRLFQRTTLPARSTSRMHEHAAHTSIAYLH